MKIQSKEVEKQRKRENIFYAHVKFEENLAPRHMQKELVLMNRKKYEKQEWHEIISCVPE